MPADITGTEILEESSDGRRRMQFVKGAIFANVILADEINRTPPKTQAALLEAMQEHQVTAAGVRYPLEEPFFVLATQNPIEMEGTYPLPRPSSTGSSSTSSSITCPKTTRWPLSSGRLRGSRRR